MAANSAPPLAGLSVLEVGEMVAAPFCAKLLGDLGADVIKVERPPAGDRARRVGPFKDDRPDPDHSALFLYLNTSKLGITLDLETATGRELFARLAAGADVVVSDRSPVDATRLGLDFPGLARANPRLVLASVTPFGDTGPYRHWNATELNVFHGGGEGFVLGAGLSHERFPDREPLMAGGYLAGYQSGLTAATGAVAAIVAREATGLGQHVDVSGQDAQLSLNHLVLMRYVDGTLETRANRGFRFGGVVPCRDGYVEILPLEQHHWEALVRMMGSPAWTADERFRTGPDRAKNGRELNDRLREWARDRTREEIYRLGQGEGCPVGPYCSPPEVFENRQFRFRQFFAPLDHPVSGRAEYPTPPFKFGGTPVELQRAAPRLGEHNAEVLGQGLGLKAAELARLRAAGII